MFVSVIVPCYNHAPYLRQRIESILNQTYQNFELILLDDVSPDESGEILLSYKDHPKYRTASSMKKIQALPFINGIKGCSWLKVN